MLTLKQLYARTSAERKHRATYVRVIKTKTGHDAEGRGFVAAQSYSRYTVNAQGRLVPNTKPNKYVTVLTFIDKKLHVHVSCSCGDYTFYGEVANTYKDAATVEYSNGEPPLIKNPDLLPSLCKHMCALYLKIKPKLPNG